MGALNKVLVNYLQKSRPPSRVTGTEALEGHSQLQVRSQGPLRTPCIRGTPSPLLSLSPQWRLQEAERPHQFSKARMKGIFTAAGMLISFGTEITTPSLIRSRELLLHLLGRRAGGWEEFGQAGACSSRRFEQWLAASSSFSLCVFPGGGSEKLDEFLGTSCSPGK